MLPSKNPGKRLTHSDKIILVGLAVMLLTACVTEHKTSSSSTTQPTTQPSDPVISVADTSILEGNAGTANLTFTVRLSGQANGNVNVDYATGGGTATAGPACTGSADYVATSGTLAIPSASTHATVTIPICGDTIYEPNEAFTLSLSNVSTNAVIGTATATGTIINDDRGGLDDTGITTCSDGSQDGLTCPVSGYPLQDAQQGRDANSSTNSNSDGHAGFSFTKIGSNGQPLAIQSGIWSSSGDDAAGTKWSCVQDDFTGLMWEVKTNDGGLHDKDWTYTWYNSTGTNDGGSAGTSGGGSCGGTVPGGCDTEHFVAAANSAGLCGYSDWRMPTEA